MTTSLDIRTEVKNFYITIPDNWKRYFINWVEYLPQERTYEQAHEFIIASIKWILLTDMHDRVQEEWKAYIKKLESLLSDKK